MRSIWICLVMSMSCAPLLTTAQSKQCERLYDACLNTCPKPPSNAPGALPQGLAIDTAACTDACNKKSRACEDEARGIR